MKATSAEYRVLVLGGYGNAGIEIARQLLRDGRVSVGIAGRRGDAAQQAAEALARETGRPVRAVQVDASDAAALREALGEHDALIVASSTSQHTPAVLDAVLARGCDYFDLWYSPRRAKWFLEQRPRIEQSSALVLVQAGLHPGLPGVIGRRLLGQFDKPRAVNVESALRPDWRSRDMSPSTIVEFDEEPLQLHYSKSAWRKVGESRRVDFDDALRGQLVYPIYLPELGHLVDTHRTLTDLTAWVGGHEIEAAPAPAADLDAEERARSSYEHERGGARPPYGFWQRVRVSGLADGVEKERTIAVHHPDGYLATALSVAATIAQRLEQPSARGLHRAADWVRPDTFLAALAVGGMQISQSWK